MSTESNNVEPTSHAQENVAGVIACHVCHLVQRLPSNTSSDDVTVCCRCETSLQVKDSETRIAWSRQAALAALVCYPLAITLPALRFERFGHVSENSIVGSIQTLFADGYMGLGIIVLLCSVLIPLCKLVGIWVVCSDSFLQTRHRARTYQLLEWSGRWGMIDVLLVAVLVALLKVGELVNVYPGPGAMLFAAVVFLSLLASYFFHPRIVWERQDDTTFQP